jgi:hypothetical protein
MNVVSHSAELIELLHKHGSSAEIPALHALSPAQSVNSVVHFVPKHAVQASDSKLHAAPPVPVSPAADADVPPLLVPAEAPAALVPAVAEPAVPPPEVSSLLVLLQAAIATTPKPRTTVKQADKARMLFLSSNRNELGTVGRTKPSGQFTYENR